MSRFNAFWLGLAGVGFVLFLPLILPTAIALHAIYRHRLRSAASRFVCIACGQVLGKESLRLSDIDWAQQMEEMRIRHPGVKFRVVRNVHAICSKCGKQYRFREQSRDFEEAPVT
jgi:hypothetical protein